MLTLRSLQEDFQSHLLSHAANMAANVVGDKRLVKKRLKIYSDAYYLRLLEALSINFPKLRKLMGDNLFFSMGKKYIAHYPSHGFSIRYFGDSVSKFLAGVGPYRKQAALSEMATFEWALSIVANINIPAVLTSESLKCVSQKQWPYMQLQLNPSVQLVRLKWNVPAIWQAIESNAQIQLESYAQTQAWVVWQKQQQSHYYSCKEHEAWLINAVISGKNFGQLCEGLCNWFSETEVGICMANQIAFWLQNEMISGVKIN